MQQGLTTLASGRPGPAEALRSRLATRDDIPTLDPLIEAAIEALQKGFLTDAQIRSSHAFMGLDRQLIDDRTYFVVEIDGQVAGCGGWSRRATLYGGDQSRGRDNALLEPARDPAKVRAMYTHPRYTRQGVARHILSLCEQAASAEGFVRLELMSTMSGQPLYTAFGFVPLDEVITEDAGGVPVPMVRMGKSIAS